VHRRGGGEGAGCGGARGAGGGLVVLVGVGLEAQETPVGIRGEEERALGLHQLPSPRALSAGGAAGRGRARLQRRAGGRGTCTLRGAPGRSVFW